MTEWHKGLAVGFDLETTGVDTNTARIVTASVVLLDAEGKIVNQREWLVDPGVEIPEAATAVHGVSTEKARAEGIPAAQAVREILGLLSFASEQAPLIAFNASYDFSVLYSEALRYDMPPFIPGNVIDPFIIDKQVDKFRKGKRTLAAACEHYGVVLENAHTSFADAVACVAVGRALAELYPQLQVDPQVLHGWQIGWAREQAESFQAYLRKSKPDAVVDGAWPIKDS
ncbi:3'-5' exonuclease [Glutamicibacter uratoxydans]|uniref:3'-5' exonuclease n=1 Tax=Glutamicibacter uratoxydans TaxID=43667 RepID=A0A4Y4DQU0_GLUUR|nr:3'-5' exonuclease [Glutamicibacter uratoxydans]GED07722.1 3'-5' exonuclease [Glutamicibacter uratoxydans]